MRGIALLGQRLTPVLGDVGRRPADDPQWQGVGDIAEEVRAGDLADDVFFGDRAHLARPVGQEIHDIPQLAGVVGRKPHGHHELLGAEAEAHRLHVAVEGGAGR